MIDIQKFLADTQRILKHDRSDNNGLYNGERASKAVAKHFISCNPGLSAVPDSLADYWLKNKILASKKIDSEPSESSIDWLADAFEILQGTCPENCHFNKKDWTELKDIMNAEADDLPIDFLTDSMSIIVEKGAL